MLRQSVAPEVIPARASRRPRLRTRRRWLIVLLTMCLSVFASIPAFAAYQYRTWGGSEGPGGCVAKAYQLFTSTEHVDACVRSRARARLDELGPVRGLVELQQQAESNQLFELRCHLPMHTIGQERRAAGWPASGLGDIADELGLTGVCTKGFVHGYLQGMGDDPGTTAAEFVRAATGLCARMAADDRGVCVHGIGHGIARGQRNELAPSSRVCGQMPSRTDERDCIKGVVMEIQFADERLAKRMTQDANLGPQRRIDCGQAQKVQQSACRKRKVGGEALRLVFEAGGS